MFWDSAFWTVYLLRLAYKKRAISKFHCDFSVFFPFFIFFLLWLCSDLVSIEFSIWIVCAWVAITYENHSILLVSMHQQKTNCDYNWVDWSWVVCHFSRIRFHKLLVVVRRCYYFWRCLASFLSFFLKTWLKTLKIAYQTNFSHFFLSSYWR